MFKYLNRQVKKMNWFDFKVVGICGALLGLLAATIFDFFTSISFVWYLVPAVLCYVYFGFRLFRK